MLSVLQEKLTESTDFLFGVELVSTRGTISEENAIKTRNFADALVDCPHIDWASITDNAGGNPMLAPSVLGKPILFAGKEVVIHLSCKDLNRNGLESTAWALASEGFTNILTLSGDYPIAGSSGRAKPVFDIDSVALLSMLTTMNAGMALSGPGAKKGKKQLLKTHFFPGAVVTNFKYHENEVMPQYLKLARKIASGARFIINQVGYDSVKIQELIHYMNSNGMGNVPLIGNVYLLSGFTARLFNSGKIPGVVVSDELREVCQKEAKSPDLGKAFFLELAAKQVAVYRGMGYRGAYFGGVHSYKDVERILEIDRSFGKDDWKKFACEIQYSRPGEFFLYDRDPDTGYSIPGKLNPEYEASLKKRSATRNITLNYRLSKFVHDLAFEPGRKLFPLMQKFYRRYEDNPQGPLFMRLLEDAGKLTLYRCKDCGDCSLPDTAFLCPESQCAKNQRNGPCGGTRDGLCEVNDKNCIWARAYDRHKYEGNEQDLLEHAPVAQDQALRGTSSWANTFLGRDHTTGKKE